LRIEQEYPIPAEIQPDSLAFRMWVLRIHARYQVRSISRYIRRKKFDERIDRAAIWLEECNSALQRGLSRCRVRSSRLQMNAVSGCNAHGGAPCLEGLGTEPTLRCRRDEMATDVESIVDRGMCRKESLSRSG
jgi:hypothetical protein